MHIKLQRFWAVLPLALLSSAALATDRTADVSIGAKMYAHFGYDMKPTPYEGYVDGDPRPNEFDIDRAYLNFRAKIDQSFSARITTDVSRTNDERLEVVLKYAYLQVAFEEGIKLQFGSAGTPLVGFTESFWGHRWAAQSFADSTGVLNSADLGVHAQGTHADGLIGWGASVVNGEGIGRPDEDGAKAFQGRFTVDALHSDMSLPISVFFSKDFYTHNDVDGHTVLSASAGFDSEFVGVWAEYLSDDAGDLKGEGMSGHILGKVPDDLFNVLIRVDKWDPDTAVDDDAQISIRFGLTKDFAKKISAGLLYEQTKYEMDPDQPEKGIFLRMQAGF
jgi:hypothetical protein